MDCSLGEAESHTTYPIRASVLRVRWKPKVTHGGRGHWSEGRAHEKERSPRGRLTCEVSDPPLHLWESSVTLCFAESRKSSSLVQPRPGAIVAVALQLDFMPKVPASSWPGVEPDSVGHETSADLEVLFKKKGTKLQVEC